MKNHKQELMVWALLAVFGICGAVSGGNRVLCFGEEGHSKIEQVVETCFKIDVSAASSISSRNCNHEGSECGNCNDVQVSDLFSSSVSEKRTRDFLTPHVAIPGERQSSKLTPITTPRTTDILPVSFSRAFQLVVATTVIIC